MARARLSSPSPASPTRAEPILRLYGRARCPLCDEMAAELHALGLAFAEIDVDAEPALRARYGRRVPVLADAEDREICHGHLDSRALRARLGLE